MIITFDGVSASGKSTAAKLLANRLGISYIASGLVYRFATYINNKYEISLDELIKLVLNDRITYIWDGNNPHIFLDSNELTEKLGSNEISTLTSILASAPEKIIQLNEVVYSLIKSNNIASFTIDGRNVGSALFPQADYKFYITANSRTRAQRRYKELLANDPTLTLETIHQDLIDRDERDRNRLLYPLVIPDGAIIIDTSHISNIEMIENIIKALNFDSTNERIIK